MPPIDLGFAVEAVDDVTVVPAVIPQRQTTSHAGAPPGPTPSSRRPLPLASHVAQVRTRTSVYGLAAVDHRGRIADSTISEILRWIPGTRVSVTVSAGLVDVLANPDGTSAINRDGHFLLPAATRHQVGLRPGERVLLVVEPDEQSLAVYPPAVLDMILTRHGTLLAGGTDD